MQSLFGWVADEGPSMATSVEMEGGVVSAAVRRLSGGGASVLSQFFGPCVCEGVMSNCQQEIDGHIGIVLWFLLLVYVFKVLGTVCDEYFVPSLEAITEQLQLSNDVAGATFMAAGSSAPELFTSLVTTFFLVSEGGVGTIIGSAIFNILVIVGATCFYAQDGELVIWWYPLARDSGFYCIAIFQLFIFLYNDEQVMAFEGIIMTLSYVVYIVYMKFNEKVAEYFAGAPDDVMPAELDEGGEGQGASNFCTGGPPGAFTMDGNEEGQPNNTSIPGATPDPETVGASQQNPQVPQVTVTAPTEPPGRQEARRRSSQGQHSHQQGHQHQHRQSALLRQGSFNVHGGHAPMWSNKQLKRQKTEMAGLDGSITEENTAEDNKPAEQEHAEKVLQEGAPPAAEEEDEEEEKKGWFRDPLLVLMEFIMPSSEKHHWLLFYASITWIALLSYVMVDACERIGCILNIAKLVMGLIFLAAGTSVPDALGSIAVAKQGEGDMAVANALGSNVFDIMLGLGVPWSIKTLFMNENPYFPGAKKEIVIWIIVLIAVLVLFVGSLVVNKWRLNKKMGGVLLGLYGVYVVFALVKGLVLDHQ